MSSSILDSIMGQLQSGQLDDIANKIGADRKQTETAISATLPTMIEALGRKSSKGGSMDDLLGSIGLNQGSLGGLASSLGGAGKSSASPNASQGLPGGDMLSNLGGIGDLVGGLFGQKKDRVESSIGKSSGLSGSQVAMLMSIVGPLVLSALSKRAKASSSNSVDDVLQEERAQINSSGGGSMLGKLFDQDGDGDFDFSDIVKLGFGKLFSRS